jgi:hypothetical protein
MTYDSLVLGAENVDDSMKERSGILLKKSCTVWEGE